MELTTPTKLEYYDQMLKLQSKAILLHYFKGDDGRKALILDQTIFHPQGGGQPADTGFICITNSNIKFCVQDVRSKDGVVFHYGVSEDSSMESEFEQGSGKEVILHLDESRRRLNSRLHSAGHLLDVCMTNVGFGHLEPGKGYHFPDGIFGGLILVPTSGIRFRRGYFKNDEELVQHNLQSTGICELIACGESFNLDCLPFVEYKGTVPPNEVQNKQREIEIEVNALISKGGKVYAAVLPYEEAAELCGGTLPDYIPPGSNPRIIKLGDNPGCPCGGTHVSDISEIVSMKVSQIRTKKGMTKVFYTIGI